ncbi:ATP synthase subunit C lysine N-methyltransferase isoform X3 [Hippopotamus amphibius kiboko]|uniref:ATP synthase subunit C lysine N-methyltransferase isoform X3 n=1 Tax=Hippopotamus amphibius kiboko TaxID=575201 RepID=UPI00259491B7|nr:ATP synthase subunit C lysine N-methyltransferase isoform X3 [Hippopotamus amphibius kiboko]
MVESTSGFLTTGNLAMEGGGTPPGALREERQLGCVPPTSPEANSLRKSSWGFLFTGIVGGMLVAVYAVATPFITPALRRICLPFVPATTKQVENVVKMLRGRRGPLVDIGSGDGRIVIAAAKEGFTAVGYELNPWLVWYSRYCARREGVQASARFYISDLWKVTFSQYSNVVIFGVPQMDYRSHNDYISQPPEGLSNESGLLIVAQMHGAPSSKRATREKTKRWAICPNFPKSFLTRIAQRQLYIPF